MDGLQLHPSFRPGLRARAWVRSYAITFCSALVTIEITLCLDKITMSIGIRDRTGGRLWNSPDMTRRTSVERGAPPSALTT
jgi:hypothetical protein